MNQHEAVIKVMEENGGYATFKYLYEKSLKVKGSTWKTKTPFASIRRIVQNERFFFKIRPGLWALKSQRETLKRKFKFEDSTKREENRFTHSFYQGLLVEIGNLNNLDTYVPNQDKNKLFLSKKLSDVATLSQIYQFTNYQTVARSAKTIDVIWFNSRKFPSSMFEVEYTTSMENSLVKFVELQDFNTKFRIVCDESRRRYFEDKISRSAFQSIRDRVDFWNFDYVSELHSYKAKLNQLEKGIKK